MGNYNGTVRCGACYERGHNKRSCPTVTRRLVDRLESYQTAMTTCDEEQKPRYEREIGRLAEQIGKRTGNNPLTGAKITKRGPTRRCSYCKHKHGSWGDEGLGHTRRTCPDLKTDMAERVKSNAAYRAGMLETLREAGVGVGTLITTRVSGYFSDGEGGRQWDRRNVATMVRKINWDRINCVDHHGDFILLQRMDMLGTRDGYATLPAPRRYMTADDGSTVMVRFHGRDGWGVEGSRVGSWDAAPAEPERHAQHVLAGVPPESINPPAGWETGESAAIVEYFKGLKA